MPTVTDTRFEYLRSQGYTGSTNDMLMQWLQANTVVQAATLSDQRRAFLEEIGIPSPFQINDAWYQYLGLLFLRGSMADRELQFWQGGALVIPIAGSKDFSNGFSTGFS